MDNAELESILKKAQVPARPEEFWEMFPRRVVSRLNRPPVRSRAQQPWWPRFAWGLATAICLLAAFAIGRWHGRMEKKTNASNDILQNAKLIRETLAMFPNQVCAIVRDQHGLNLVLSNQGDVPASPPIYVRVCDGKNCSSCVTFSGQEIQIAGQKLTVLSNSHGGIILSGDHFLWSSDGRVALDKGLQIEAKGLGRL